MTVARLLLAAAALSTALAVATSAQAQIAPPYLSPGVDPHRYQADQHRYEIDRLRAQADQRETFARQLQIETRLSRQEIEAARRTDITEQPGTRVLRSPEEARALRESATRRRQTTASRAGEIDDWLDRPTR
ncbi:hypothetical protein [Brevundimonas sp.]|uniref:hypothetical protein n=1 Tax=Brevundimonas sp. TaxID=1871086 RepID=UPI002D2B9B6A|nr:hypothetical protein [Brevundimonas sp.]HYC67206.1 hypothetical protein [Brevundimonas sp.]